MPDGNRYAAAMDPQAGPAGPPPAMPPQGAPPQGPPQGQPADQPDPAVVEAFQILSGHDGPIEDLLKNPKNLPQIRAGVEAIKKDPAAQQQLVKAGITADMFHQFEQQLAKAEQGAQKAVAPHWLAR